MRNPGYSVDSAAGRSARSPFTEPAAVDAWDAWFRWRDHGVLRDITVDATWDRVASALGSIESVADKLAWKRQLIDALRSWRLLLDGRILATAGTSSPAWREGSLVAVLNAASFVRTQNASQANFDLTTFENVAAISVRALDNAAMLIGNDSMISSGFRIGIIGLADALAQLGLAYDSIEGRAQAEVIARALAQACHRGSSQLVHERGATQDCSEAWRARAGARDMKSERIDESTRLGIRHQQLTAVTSQPKLALLANNVTDALDPLIDSGRAQIALTDAQHGALARSRVSALSRQYGCPTPRADRRFPVTVAAQFQLRGALQRWIDEPIAYPLLVDSEPSQESFKQWVATAARLGLGPTSWRRSENRRDRSVGDVGNPYA